MEWVPGFMGNENEIKTQLTTPIKGRTLKWFQLKKLNFVRNIPPANCLLEKQRQCLRVWMASIYQIITELGKFQFVIKVCLKYFWNFLFKLSLSDDSLQLLKCSKSPLKSVELVRQADLNCYHCLVCGLQWIWFAEF